MSLFQKLPPPNLDRLLDIGTRDSKNNIVEERKTFVVTIRDLFPGARSHLAMTLKVPTGIICRWPYRWNIWSICMILFRPCCSGKGFDPTSWPCPTCSHSHMPWNSWNSTQEMLDMDLLRWVEAVRSLLWTEFTTNYRNRSIKSFWSISRMSP